ncbi:MAG: hypothetical protein IAC13_08885 [Firmicutes bacterium]|uniref:Uncharacterized protein n=1 Tax=Candidatus Scybalomonas excrementavium TaxID=2840943 RepID=A0A9D9I1D2_9FIRM|nr:hypothetical protein [Candidatus Scybalomonas excrementavium]
MRKLEKKIVYVGGSIILILLIVAILFFQLKDDKKEIRIGVPLVDNEIYQYDILKEELEAKFSIKIKYVDLYKDLYEDATE